MSDQFDPKQAISSYYAKRRGNAERVQEPTCTAARLYWRASKRQEAVEQLTDGWLMRLLRRALAMCGREK